MIGDSDLLACMHARGLGGHTYGRAYIREGIHTGGHTYGRAYIWAAHLLWSEVGAAATIYV